MSADTPPATTWYCTRCERVVEIDIRAGMDPRYATGLCGHGDPEREAKRVPLVSDGEKARPLVDRVRHGRTLRRALRKMALGQDLSRSEREAVERDRREKAPRV